MTQTTLDPVTAEVTQLLLTAINSVYTGPKVEQVYDAFGIEPSEVNGYLLSEDGESFSGIFVTETGTEHEFTVRDNNGVWQLKY